LTFAALWFALFLLPTLVVPDLPAYEHRAYVPLLGLTMSLAWLIDRRRWLESWAGLAGAAVLTLAFAGLSVRYAPTFADPLSYWTAGTSRMPFAPIAYVNLGQLYEQRGDVGRAESAYRRALQLDEGTPKAYNNLGVVLAGRRDFAGAREMFEREVARHPLSAEAVYNLGVVRKVEGDMAAAVPFWRRALEIDRYYVPAYEQLIAYYELKDDRAEAEHWRAELARIRKNAER
jgi:tetratricopeptide (TPR) repeat protein